MELWIRSQDKTNLIRVEHLALTNNKTITGMSTNWDYDLGTYTTKERALEVLDEIQNILKPKIIYNCNGTINQLYDYTKVYEMPQE